MNPSDQNQINRPPPVPGRLSCDSYVSRDIRDYGDRVRKSAGYYAQFRKSWSGPLIASAADSTDDEEEEEGEFGFSTPPAWYGPTSPGRYSNQYRGLPPASKAQAIARGQRELMEMVSKMPESNYELSLKDIVEKQQQLPVVEEKKEEQEIEKEVMMMMMKEKNEKKLEIVKKKKKNGKKNSDDGFLLKMVFPLAFGMKKKEKKNKKKTELGSSNSFKVAPRPPMVEGNNKGVDKEWWKKRFEQCETESSESSSSNNGSGKSSISSNSSSSLSRNNSR